MSTQFLISLENAGFKALCTPNHSWVEEMRRNPSAKNHRTPARRLRPATELGAGSLILAALESNGGQCPLLAREAAIWGWILTDGTWRNVWNPQHGYYPRLHIDQSKEAYVNEIRELLGTDATEQRYQPGIREFPTGNTSVLRPSHRFNLSATLARLLLDKTDAQSEEDFPAIACHLTPAARTAMLDSMLKGDGTRHGETWVFGNTNPAIMETFQILATLEGYAVGRLRVEGGGGYFLREAS